MAPDDKTIALVHLAQDIPTQLIYLQGLTFVSFVSGHYDEPELKRQVMFLATDRRGKTKLYILEVNPW